MEDSKIQLKAEASQICKMLSKPDNERMPFEGVEIAKSLQRITFLSKFVDMKSEEFINLCITSRVVEFSPNTDIYSLQGERYIYIILEGRVKATLKNQQNSIFQQSKHYLSQFGIFGETEILFGLKERSQCIVTQTAIVKCLIFQEQLINKLINPSMTSYVDKSFKYLQVNEYFQVIFVLQTKDLSEFQKKQLITYLTLKTFSKGDHIIQIGTEINSVIFIIYGQLSVVKNIMLKSSSKREIYKIDELSEMNSFGEYECCNQLSAQHSLIAQSTGAFYSLDYSALKNSNHKILSIIKEKAIPYPDQEELNFLNQIKNNLKSQQSKIVRKNKLF